MGSLAVQEVETFLVRLGKVFEAPAVLYLIGGGALCLLGNPRRTLDLDFSLTLSDETQKLIDAITIVADELHIEVEVITLEEFVPLPANAQIRHRYIGQFGHIEVYVYDPYTIALSKLARGLETDIQDVFFLLESGWIEIEELERFVGEAMPAARAYDIDPADLMLYMGEVRRLYPGGDRKRSAGGDGVDRL